jgi:hypothetical protein
MFTCRTTATPENKPFRGAYHPVHLFCQSACKSAPSCSANDFRLFSWKSCLCNVGTYEQWKHFYLGRVTSSLVGTSFLWFRTSSYVEETCRKWKLVVSLNLHLTTWSSTSCRVMTICLTFRTNEVSGRALNAEHFKKGSRLFCTPLRM